MVAQFLTKFWMVGEGRALAFREATSGTQEVLGPLFCCILFFDWFGFL